MAAEFAVAGGRHRWLLNLGVPLAVVVLLYLRACWRTISTSQCAVIERFGKFARIARPGLHMVWRPFYRVAGTVSTRVQQLNVETDTKTKDNVTVDLTVAVQYRVIDKMVNDGPPAALDDGAAAASNGLEASEGGAAQQHGVWRAFYRLTGIEYQLKAYVEDVVRSELPQKTLDEAYETKDAVAVAVSARRPLCAPSSSSRPPPHRTHAPIPSWWPLGS